MCTDRMARRPDERTYPFCDACGRQIVIGATSLQGIGIACSEKCMNTLCLQHEAAMVRRG